jgi:hypothetical protein
MPGLRFEFAGITLDAELMDTPTAQAIAATLPVSASVMTWGEEVYFPVPVKIAAEKAPAPWSHPVRLPTGRKGTALRSDMAARRSAKVMRHASRVHATSSPARSAT